MLSRRTVALAWVLSVLLGLVPASDYGQQPELRHVFSMVKPRISKDLSYEDSIIRIHFVIGNQLSFKLLNKTRGPIEIHWGSASFIDTEGSAHKITHDGVRHIDRNSILPPTIVPPGASISDLMHPTDYVTYDSDSSAGWKVKDLLYRPLGYYENKQFSAFMPIKIGAVIRNYRFTFTVSREIVKPRVARDSPKINRARVARDEYGQDWPFLVDEGVLACSHDLYTVVVFIAKGQPYALNGAAIGFRIDEKVASQNIDEIVVIDPSTNKKKSLTRVLNAGLQLCR